MIVHPQVAALPLPAHPRRDGVEGIDHELVVDVARVVRPDPRKPLVAEEDDLVLPECLESSGW